jgi:hypothetical protein
MTHIASRVSGHQPRLTLELDVAVESRAPHKPAMVAVDVLDAAGVALMQALPSVEGFVACASSAQRIRIAIDLPPMIPGQYFATVWLGAHFSETLDVAERAIRFEVHDTPTTGRSHHHSPDHGAIVPLSAARCEPL